MHILFRCDASLNIGSGHVIRCRSLARVLRKQGAEITFLCRRQPGDLICLLEQEFRVVVLLEHPLVSCEELEGRKLYAAWLGCSQEQDAMQCLDSLSNYQLPHPSWVVVDHYGLDSFWETKLLSGLAANTAISLLVIDDLADRPHCADILLDQNFFRDSSHDRYSDLVSEHCIQLLGPSYSLLGPEYAQLHPLIPFRTELRRVLVFFGGVDSMNLTSRVLDTLSNASFNDLAIDVVLGLQSNHRHEVAERVLCRPYTTLHSSLPSLAGLIARADLCIGAGGATTWERACLGLTTITVPIAQNQLICASEFSSATSSPLVKPSELLYQLPEILLHFCRDPDSLILSSEKAFNMTDGFGCNLVASEILK